MPGWTGWKVLEASIDTQGRAGVVPALLMVSRSRLAACLRVSDAETGRQRVMLRLDNDQARALIDAITPPAEIHHNGNQAEKGMT